jgi:O-antigen ligase/Flp pilus assembly protein TadD
MSNAIDTADPSPDKALLLSVSFLLVAVPFAYSRQVFDSGLTPKLLALMVGALLVSLSWLRLALQGRTSTQGTIMDVPMFLYILILVLQWTRAYDVYQASLEVAKMVALGITYLAVTRCSTEAHRRFWVSLLVVIGFLVGMIGILQYLGIGFLSLPTAGLPSSTFAYRNTAAMFTIVVIPFAFLRLMQSKAGPGEKFWALALTTLFIFLAYTRTRGAWVGFLASVIIASALFCVRHRTFGRPGHLKQVLPPRKAAILALVVLVTAVASPFTPSVETVAVPQVSRMPEAKKSTVPTLQTIVSTVKEIPTGDIAVGEGRYGFWKVSAWMIRDHPWIGVGLTNWEKEYPKYLEVLWGNKVPRRPHNDYLWVAAELGIFGIFAYLSIFVLATVAAYRAATTRIHSGLASAALAGVAAIQCHALVSFPLERIGPILSLWFCLSVLGALGGGTRRGGLIRPFLPALSVVVILAGSVIVVRASASEIATGTSLVINAREEGEGALHLLEQSEALGVFDYRHLMYHSRIYTDNDRLDDAFRVSEEVIRRHPNSLNGLRNLGELSAATGRHSAAAQAYEKAIELRPTPTNLQVSLGRVYIQMGTEQYHKNDLDRALSYFLKAVALRGDLPLAYFGIGNVYFRRNQKSAAADAYEKGIRFDPENASAHFALGTLYKSMGEDSLAVKHLHISMRDSSNAALQEASEALLSGPGEL